MNDAPTPPQNAPTQPAQGSHKLSTWSLILGIAAIGLAVIFFISIPAAIIAVVFGILVLTRHYPGKSKALAGLITGSLALLIFIPGSLALAYYVFENKDEILEKLDKTTASIESKTESKTNIGTTSSGTSARAEGNKVITDCYTYAIPEGYEYNENSKECITSVNIPRGDILTRIVVKPNTGKIGTLQDAVDTLNAALKKSMPDTEGVVDQKEYTTNGHTIYYINYKDSNGLSFANYVIPDPNSSQKISGEAVTAYTIAGYTNPALKEVADSVILK